MGRAISASRVTSRWSRHAGRLAGLTLVLVVVLCLGGGTGAYFLLDATEPRGQLDPAAAVNGFLRAIFTEHDSDHAADFVCPAAARSGDLRDLVNKIRDFEDQFAGGRTSWSDPTISVHRHRATATLALSFDRDGQQLAQRRLELLVVDQRGWWVCAVTTAG
jgi:hypothetical protein